jgi:hypothetical protein
MMMMMMMIMSCILMKQDTQEWTGIMSLLYSPVNMVMNLKVTVKAGNSFEYLNECYNYNQEWGVWS